MDLTVHDGVASGAAGDHPFGVGEETGDSPAQQTPLRRKTDCLLTNGAIAGSSQSARSVSAAFSGTMSLMKAPIADSEPARYFSLSAARRIENSCMCR